MRVTLERDTVRDIGEGPLRRWVGAIDEDRHWYSVDIALPNYSNEELAELLQLLKNKKKARVPIGLIKKFIEMRKTGKWPRCSTAKQMEVTLTSFIATQCPDYCLYYEMDGHLVKYYVDKVWYNPPTKDRSGYPVPAECCFKLKWVEQGQVQNTNVSWVNSECMMTAPAKLAEEGYLVEDEELKARYDASLKKYAAYVNEVGMQCLATGFADISSSRYSRSSIKIDAGGSPACVVVDTVSDDSDSKKNSRTLVHNHQELTYQWDRKKKAMAGELQLEHDEAEDDEVAEDDDWGDTWDDDDEEENEYEAKLVLPTHPFVDCFDLRRHCRVYIHVNNIEKYIYDTALERKLILDPKTKKLVGLLAAKDNTVEYQDVVAGKGGGTTVLLAGDPGTGKTLTAEIFAETVERPLYRVQCSQLGTSPDSIEKKLMKVFERSARWNAIILLDEADVYIQARGGNINRNAIVGCFLRVLEYQESTMFMTTNLPDSVDDAIASRCIARIDYAIPSESDALQIWDVLTEAAGVNIDTATRMEVVERLPYLSGRDIKMILKLLWAQKDDEGFLTADQIVDATQFHPCRGNWRKAQKAAELQTNKKCSTSHQ